MKTALLLSSFAFLFAFNGQSQEVLKLKSGDYSVSQLEASNSVRPNEKLINGKFYRIVVFNEIPDESTKRELSSAGFELIEYLPHRAFITSISSNANWSLLDSKKVLKVVDIVSDFKKSKGLFHNDIPHWALFGESQLELAVTFYNDLSSEETSNALADIEHVVVEENHGISTKIIRIELDDLEALLAIPAVQYADAAPEPGEPENLPGRTDHRSNTLWTSYQSGLKFRGDGVNVLMQDDGIIGPHIDYTGRDDQSNCIGCSTDPNDDHGDHVGGTIMGAGNLNPKYRGMAHGANLIVYQYWTGNYAVIIPPLYNNDSMVISSASYSNGCNAGYTSLTQTLDQQTRDYPALIHVFSAGNNGSSACSGSSNYGAGCCWGNITGGHKAGKNVMTVANLNDIDNLNSSSSRGPASDGRIKPDISAVGTQVMSTLPGQNYAAFTGTSMSCPGVSGTLAQLYEAYRSLNGGQNPESGLIKAAVLNSAEDIGNPGPDFKHGWGRINARQAFDLLSNNMYLVDSVSQGGQNVHNITVPAGVRELRVMTYWTDYQGSTSASIALVNDINMVVTDPNTTNYNPWVLDPTPNATTLDLPAVQGVDNLNNMEQVTIDDPVAGVYTVSVDGFGIPQGPQKYYVVYYFVYDEIHVTYPLGGEGFEPQTTERIRWDASEGTDPFNVSYSLDDGATWTLIGTANADERQQSWTVPNGTLSGLARVKVERNGLEGISDTTFSIIGVPQNIDFVWACPDSTMITWDSVPGATAYEVSMLGAKYMDSIGTSTTTSFVAQVPSTDEGWFSVKALGPDNAIGERAIAVQKSAGEYGCLWSAPYADFSIDCPSAGAGSCFNVYDQSINTDPSATFTYYFPGGTPATSNSPNPNVCYSAPGTYDVAMVVDNGFGVDSIYMTGVFNVVTTPALPYFEGFENYFNFNALEEWSVNNPDLNGTWLIGNVGLNSSKSAKMNNYGQDAGYIDELISGPIDLSSLVPGVDQLTLSYRYAYVKRVTSNWEWLKLYVRGACTDGWVVRKSLGGTVLGANTAPNNWIPTSENDWVTIHVTNITDIYWTSNFQMKFQFEGDDGNNLYLDNINIYNGAPSDTIVGLEEIGIENIGVYPNPTSSELNVSFDQSTGSPVDVIITDLSGKSVFSRSLMGQPGNNIVVIDTHEFSSGMYLLTLKQGEHKTVKRFIAE